MKAVYTQAMNPVICILHYGDAGRTRELRKAFLEAEPGEEARVLVLDNASPDPYPQAWKRLPENRYWAGALAWALDALGDAGYTHLWFCNNDIIPLSRPPFLARLAARVRRLERGGCPVGLISPAFTANPYHAQMIRKPGEQCRQAMYIDGIAPLINLQCVRRLGGLDAAENPYGYGVDVWLSLRAVRAGWGVYVDDALLFRHQYHTAARAKKGFLSVAAATEEAYLAARLGADWRDVLRELSAG